jgi:hypothetical protein
MPNKAVDVYNEPVGTMFSASAATSATRQLSCLLRSLHTSISALCHLLSFERDSIKAYTLFPLY